jgi:hypothetical protein
MEAYKIISFALLATWAARALADDAVGLIRVDAGTDGLVEAEMPFSPIGNSGPLGYVSGAFLGDGGSLSDQLFRYDKYGISKNQQHPLMSLGIFDKLVAKYCRMARLNIIKGS